MESHLHVQQGKEVKIKLYIVVFLNVSKLHVFGEWFDPSQSVYALRDRGTLSTITAQDCGLTAKCLRDTLPRGGRHRL